MLMTLLVLFGLPRHVWWMPSLVLFAGGVVLARLQGYHITLRRVALAVVIAAAYGALLHFM